VCWNAYVGIFIRILRTRKLIYLKSAKSVDEPLGKAAMYLMDTLLDPEWGSSSAAERTCFNRVTGYPQSLYAFFEDVGHFGVIFSLKNDHSLEEQRERDRARSSIRKSNGSME